MKRKLINYFWAFIIPALIMLTGYIFLDTIIHGNSTTGWPSIVCIMLFLGGIQLIFLGVIGEYIGRIYNEVKQRPNYIVKELVK